MSETDPLTLPTTLRVAVRTSGHAVRDAFQHTRGWLSVSALLFALHATIPAAQVLLLKNLVQTMADPDAPAQRLGLAVAGLTVVVGLNFPIGQIALAAAQRMGLQLKLHYHQAIAGAAARLHPSQLADAKITTVLQRADRAVEPMGQVPNVTLQLAGSLFTSISLCVAICSFDVLAGIFVMAALVPTVGAFTFIARAESAGWPKIAEAQRRALYANEQLIQQRSGAELATLGSGWQVADIVARHYRRTYEVLDRLIGVAMRWEALSALGTAVLLTAALLSMITAQVGAALAAAAVAGILSGLSAIRLTGYAFGTIVTAGPQAMAYRDLLDQAPATTPRKIRRADAVAVHGLAVTYPGATEPAVRDISLTVKSGEVIALVGVNGAGKTTTINAITGSVTADQGTIHIGDVDAVQLTEADRLTHFGLLTQEFGRYEFTVREVVSLGHPSGDITDVSLWEALEAAHAADLIRSLPDGIDTQLGQQWGGVGLSGGQWQRLALARICLRDAGIWILDEPTSAIDAEAEAEIFAHLQRTKADRATIVVSHRAWTLKGMDRIYVFDHGRIVQTGNYEELLSGAGRFRELFAEQLIIHPQADRSPSHG